MRAHAHLADHVTLSISYIYSQRNSLVVLQLAKAHKRRRLE